MTSSTIIGLVKNEAPLFLYDFGATAGTVTPDVMGRANLTWGSAPTVIAPADTGPGGLGYASVTTNKQATTANADFLPVGNISFAIEAVMKIATGGRGSICTWGKRGSSGNQIFVGTDSNQYPTISNWGQDYSLTGAGAIPTNANAHLWFQYNALTKKMDCYINSVLAGSVSLSNLNIVQNLPLYVFGYSGEFPDSNIPRINTSIAMLAVHLVNPTSAVLAQRLAQRQQVVGNQYKLAGQAVLDNGDAASLVQVRRVTDGGLVARIVPAASDGSWAAFVPSGDYAVEAEGPAGYRPVCDSPVSAVAA